MEQDLTKTIDEALTKLEPYLIEAVKYCGRASVKEDVAQNVRIALWELFLRDKEERDYTSEEILAFFQTYLRSCVFFCSGKIRQELRTDRNRNRRLNMLYYDENGESPKLMELSIDSEGEVARIDFNIDLEKYKKVLTKKEYHILKYLSDMNMEIKNFDAIGRQMGYLGKGGIKYVLTNIAKKIKKLNEP